MLRRHFLRLFTSGVLFGIFASRSRGVRAANRYSFRHGVASGDPLADGVIIWTRVSGASGEAVRVDWQVGSDEHMQSVLRQGHVTTGERRDYTVKVDVRELPPGTQLFYRFTVNDVVSTIGVTRTLPAGNVDAVRLAVVSCASYPTGYFHVYREVASRDDIDAVIHLGDYIYEYGQGGYATEYAEQLGRVPDPAHELLSLQDYRSRHAQYRTDADLQAMHAAHPVIAVWDDHEIVNDGWRKGSADHSDDEGRWGKRRDAAIQSYFEWMPIRGEARGKRTRIFRQFHFGTLLSLIMLDTRFYGRDEQPRVTTEMSIDEIYRVLGDPKRRMLGARQEKWLREALAGDRTSTWQIIGQQVLASPLKSPDLEPLLDPEGSSSVAQEVLDYNIALSRNNPPLLIDTWDGYAAARDDLLTDLKELARNPVVVSGDLHTSIAGNLLRDGDETPVAVEFMTGSVTSPGFAEYLPERFPGALRDATLELNPNLKYMETDRRGWLHLTVTATDCTGEWHLVDDVRSKQYTSTIDRRLTVAAGRVSDGLYAS